MLWRVDSSPSVVSIPAAPLCTLPWLVRQHLARQRQFGSEAGPRDGAGGRERDEPRSRISSWASCSGTDEAGDRVGCLLELDVGLVPAIAGSVNYAVGHVLIEQTERD
jgi:hypothetical protein